MTTVHFNIVVREGNDSEIMLRLLREVLYVFIVFWNPDHNFNEKSYIHERKRQESISSKI